MMKLALKITGKISLAVALLLGLVVSAKADSTISYTSSTSGTFDLPSTPLALQQFNTSLGTLDSITISLSANSYTSLTVSNSSPTPYGSGSSVHNDVQILLGSSPFDQAVDALNPNYGNWSLPNAWLDVTSHSYNVSGLGSGATENFSGNNISSSGGPAEVNGITSGTIFSDLQGTGTENLDVYSESFFDQAISGGATVQDVETVTGGISVTVTYDYTPAPVPEPSAMFIFGLGLCSLAIIQRRRSA